MTYGLGFSTWLHGEAVAAGMVMAVRMKKKITCVFLSTALE